MSKSVTIYLSPIIASLRVEYGHLGHFTETLWDLGTNKKINSDAMK